MSIYIYNIIKLAYQYAYEPPTKWNDPPYMYTYIYIQCLYIYTYVYIYIQYIYIGGL